MAAIRQLGLLPCPRCKVPLTEAHLFGTQDDRQKRLSLQRTDYTGYKEAVLKAQKKIKKENYAVDSAFVERQLKDESLVPTLVRFKFLYTLPRLAQIYFDCRMPSQID